MSGGTLLLVIAVLLLVPFLVPVDRFRPLIVRLAEDNTGRKVEIEALRLRLLPTIHLQVVNLRVRNPQGFPSGDTLAVKSVDIGTTLGSVLARRLNVTAVSFNGVQANLLERVGGKTNYDFSGRLGRPAATNAAGTKNAPAFSLDRIDSVTARNVKITSGTYDPIHRQIVPSFAIAGLNVRVGGINLGAPNWMDSVDVAGDLRGMTFSNPALPKPLQIHKGSFTVRGGRARATYSLAAFGGTVQGAAVVDFATAGQPARMTAQVRGVDVGAMMKAAAPAGQQGIAGKLDADAHVATALGQDPLAALIAAGTFTLRDGTFSGLLKPLQIPKGSFSVKGGGAVGTFAASLDTLRAEGTITVANLKDPVADFDVTVPELDVDRVRTLVAGGRGGAPPVGLGGPQRLLAKGTIKIGRLRARPLEASSVTSRTNVYTDRVAVDSYSLSLYGGTARGTAAVDYAAALQPAQATAQVRGVDFSKVMTALAPAAKQKITGTLEADAHVATALTQDPLTALTGTGTFAVRNGTLPGLDIKNTLVNMAKIVQVVPSGPTKFRYFGGDFRIEQQRVYSTALKLDAEGLQGTAQGSSGFDRTLNYTGIGNVNGSLLGQSQTQLGNLSLLGNALGGTATPPLGDYSARVPFSLKGTFDDPKFSPAGAPQISRGSAPAKQQPQPEQPGQNPLKFLPLPFGP